MLVTSDFQPAPYLRNPHLQTVFAATVRPSPRLVTRVERIELPDGDFLDLDWLPGGRGPIVIVLHGLTGSIQSRYARGLLAQIQCQGWRGLLLNFRGARGEPNRLPRGYHSGETGDFDYVVQLLRRRHPQAFLCAAGYSLGGNVLLKWLGEQGGKSSLSAAVAVSVPFDLALCAQAINQGLSRHYQAHLLKSMRAMARLKFSRLEPPFPLPDLDTLTDFYNFDDAFTAPLHGFEGVDDYYTRSSSRQYLAAIKTPTLIIHAEDDPFMSPAVVPAPQELSAAIRLELSKHGGHVGFVAADAWGRPSYWLEQRIPEYLQARLAAADAAPASNLDYAAG